MSVLFKKRRMQSARERYVESERGREEGMDDVKAMMICEGLNSLFKSVNLPSNNSQPVLFKQKALLVCINLHGIMHKLHLKVALDYYSQENQWFYSL